MLHQKISTDLEKSILTGKWPPGHRIPFEHELMQQYGCSRMTVSKAISRLVAAGLIERRRRAGSFVSQPRSNSAVLTIPDLKAEVESRGQTYTYQLLKRRTLETHIGPHAEHFPDNTTAVEVTCLHLANDKPLAFEHRLISTTAVPEVLDVSFDSQSPGSWLLQHVPWTQAEHRILAANATPAVAKHLNVKPNAACLIVERRTWRKEQTITWVRQSFRADHYQLLARFSPKHP